MPKNTGYYYYIRYLPKARYIDYTFLFALLEIAEYDTKKKTYSIVKYRNIRELAEKVNVSTSTLNRILSFKGNYEEYKDFIEVDKKNKVITLLNDFANRYHIKYVIIPKNTFTLLRQKNDNFLIKYYLYLKYYYSYAKSKGKKGIDNTALQFLEECGYSINAGNYITKVSECNTFLVIHNTIQIDTSYTETLYLRNWYLVIDNYKCYPFL